MGYYRLSVHKEGFTVAASDGVCMTPTEIAMGFGGEVLQPPSFAMKGLQVSLVPGADQTYSTEQATWFLKGEEVTVNVVAAFAVEARTWLQGEDPPGYSAFEGFHLLAELGAGGQFAYVCHGHTHKRTDERNGRVRVICPGALAHPRKPRRAGLAVLDTDADELTFIDLPRGR